MPPRQPFTGAVRARRAREDIASTAFRRFIYDVIRAGIGLVCIIAAMVPHGPVRSAETGARDSVSSAAHPLPFFYDLYTFRGQGGRTAVVAAFAVEARELAIEHADMMKYRFDITLVLADTALRTVSRTDDSVHVTVRRALPGDHLLFTQLEVQAPPSRTTVQRVIMTDATTPGIGQLYSTAFTIPDYRGAQLMLSDIALGQPGAKAGWRRRDVTLALLPTSLFPASAFDVYYEIYNLDDDAEYITEIAVEPVDDPEGTTPRAPPVRLRFTDRALAAPDGTVPELRHVEASLGKGRYRITVTVTDRATAESARRTRLFDVRADGRQATLVPALPRR